MFLDLRHNCQYDRYSNWISGYQMTSYAWNIVENVKYECFRWLLHHFPYYLSMYMYIVFSIYLKIQDFYDFQLWVLQLSMLILKFGEVFGYHWIYFFKTHYQNFLQLKMPPLTCTFRLCTLDFLIFSENPQICVANVFPRIR